MIHSVYKKNTEYKFAFVYSAFRASSTHVSKSMFIANILLLCRYRRPDDTSFSCRTNNEQTQTVSRACAIIIVHYVPRDQSTRCGKKKK